MSVSNFSDFDLDDLEDFEGFEYFGDGHAFAPAVSIGTYQAECESYGPDCAVAVPVNEDSAQERKRKASASCASVELYKMPRPRILKRDVRRVFPMMWANVFNSCDYDYMLQHLYTYYDPDIALVQRDLRAPSIYCPKAIPGMQVDARGINSLAQFWFASMNVAPDLVCTLKHTCLKVRTDGTSTIQCCFTLTGTKIITLPDSSDVEANEKLAAYQAALAQSQSRASISQTAAAVAAVAPAKVAALLRNAHSYDSAASASSDSSLGVSAEDSLEDLDDSLSLSDISILDRYIDVPVTASASRDYTDAEVSLSCKSSSCSSSNSSQNNSEISLTGCSLSGISVQPEDALSDIDGSGGASPVYLRTSAKPSAVSSTATSTATSTDTASTAPKSRKKSTGASKRGKRSKDAKAPDWQALGQQAYKTGAIANSTVLQTASSLFSRDSSTSPILSPSGQQVVLTGALDCICSFEMQLNADHKVTAMVLNYIT